MHEVVKRWNIKKILYHLERIDGATAPPLPSVFRKKTRPLSNFSPLKLGSDYLLWTQTWRLNLNFNWTSFCWPFCVGAFQTKLASKTCPWNWVFCARSFTGRVDMFTSSKFWRAMGQSLPNHVMITSSLEEKFHNKTRSQPCENVLNPCPRSA